MQRFSPERVHLGQRRIGKQTTKSIADPHHLHRWVTAKILYAGMNLEKFLV